ncbi:Thioesterase/thiol ester dehydrase-isomerase [Microthyrium microscopicum]|uniref:Thioesterase/thiol ester dehydrase-isomerase n=1 Tax=Microthyrium microscopicum TaxID=703497 RepID=A0A6A6UJ55_9PEZI|nr:Thioesterase/thiol ester dehydrase-isomerase [Microthyrium microscopicum]
MTKRVPLPDPKVPRTWKQQMAIEEIDITTYRSTTGAPHGPFFTRNGELRPRAFGGHVYAQAVYAASKTVDPSFLIHSVTGYFLELALADEPFIYKIQIVRDGKNYSVRKVDASQEDGKVVFSNICSFKRTEVFPDIQIPQNMAEKYFEILAGRKPDELPIKTNFKDLRAAYGTGETCLTTIFPGLFTSILPFDKIHQRTIPIKRENVYIYATQTDPSDTDSDPNLDAAAHLYHSDRESVWSMVRQYGLLDVLDSAASLSHTVTFHTGADKVRFSDSQGRRWFYLETGAERLSNGRGLHQGKIYDADGNHVATTLQDGAIRLKFKSDEERDKRIEQVKSESKI